MLSNNEKYLVAICIQLVPYFFTILQYFIVYKCLDLLLVRLTAIFNTQTLELNEHITCVRSDLKSIRAELSSIVGNTTKMYRLVAEAEAQDTIHKEGVTEASVHVE